jgi:hypothetical protein
MNSTLSSLIISGIHSQRKKFNVSQGKKQFVSDRTRRYRRKFRAVLKIEFVHTNEQTRTYINMYMRRRGSSILNHKGLTFIKIVHNISLRNSMKTHSVSIRNISRLMFTDVIDVYCKVYEKHNYTATRNVS